MVLKTGFDMLFLDADIVVMRNPLHDIVGDVDLEVQVDEKRYVDALDTHINPLMCAGAFSLKSNPRSLTFLDRMEEALVAGKDGVVDDQNALNFVTHHHDYARIINRYENVGGIVPFGGYARGPEDDRVSVRLISVESYMNGHVWWSGVQRDRDGGVIRVVNDVTGEVKSLDLSILHLNGIKEKEELMKEYHWWSLKDDFTCPL
jgi:hypothetical protein